MSFDTDALLRSYQEKINALREEMQQSFTVAIGPMVTELFTKHPIIKAIVWTQYTPYFNDGDACEFSVRDPEIILHKDDEEDDEDDEFDGESLYALKRSIEDKQYAERYNMPTVTWELVNDLEAFLGFHKNEELMEELYGDHARVVIKSDGISVSDYEHD